MSTEAVLQGKQVFTAATLSGNLASLSLSTKKIWTASVQVNIAGTPTGTLIVQGSNNRQERQPGSPIVPTDNDAGIIWTTIPAAAMLGAIPAIAGAAIAFIVVIPQCPFNRIRLFYTFGSSTGTIDAWIVGQG